MGKTIRAMNPLLQYINELLSFFAAKPIKAPSNYRDAVLEVKSTLREDVSGLVNTVLDFAINSASMPYRVDCSNENLENVLNRWLKNINSSQRGRLPTGLEALAKEYFRERWKGSSHILLRAHWTQEDKLWLPTTMYFVDGEDIKVDLGENKSVTIGKEQYKLRISSDEKEDISLPETTDETIFVQRPFDEWGNYQPVPWLIRKGIWHNLKALTQLAEKGEFIVQRALEYLLLIKKGTERMALEGNISYSQDDLTKITDEFKTLIDKKRTEEGLPTYTTQFDTSIEQFIPEYKKILDESLFAPIERKILSGLGLVEIVEGLASNRKEAVLNPKPFVSEVKQGIKDFKSLISDVIQEIIVKNSEKHRKWMNEDIEIATMPVVEFLTPETRTLMRSMYDRGLISKRTAVEVLGELDYDVEVQRRETETSKEHDEKMYPPVIQNQEQKPNEEELKIEDEDVDEDDISEDKKGLEGENYNASKIYEEAPYKTIDDLPESIKVLPADGQRLWMRAFNRAYPKGEDYARKVAWSVVKKSYKKVEDKWVKKENASAIKEELELAMIRDVKDLVDIELKKKQIAFIDSLNLTRSE